MVNTDVINTIATSLDVSRGKNREETDQAKEQHHDLHVVVVMLTKITNVKGSFEIEIGFKMEERAWTTACRE